MIKRTRWRPGVASAVLVAALAISACGSSTASQTSASASATASAGTTTVTTVTTAAQTKTAPPATAVGAPTCRTNELRLSLVSAGGAAGTAYQYYELTNVGPGACSMVGYPGVSVLDAHGKIVQHPARRGAAVAVPIRLVILGPGRRAKFLVNSTDVIPSPGCPRPYTGSTLQVYPPNQRTAILQPRTGPFCNLRVGPVQPAG